MYTNGNVLFSNGEVYCRLDQQNSFRHIYIHTHTLSDCVAELNTKNWQLSMTIKNGDFPN